MKNVISDTFPIMLYFKCVQGHFTPCRTGMQVFYCKQCHKIFSKKECERFSDSQRSNNIRRKKGIRVPFGNKTLYRFTDSVRRNYRKNPSARRRTDMTDCTFCGHDKLRHGLGKHSVRPGEGKEEKCIGCNKNCTKFHRLTE